MVVSESVDLSMRCVTTFDVLASPKGKTWYVKECRLLQGSYSTYTLMHLPTHESATLSSFVLKGRIL